MWPRLVVVIPPVPNRPAGLGAASESTQMHESPPFDGLSANRGGEIRTRDLLNPMPDLCADQRWWALVYAGIGVGNAAGQQPAAVGAVTDADTVRNA